MPKDPKVAGILLSQAGKRKKSMGDFGMPQRCLRRGNHAKLVGDRYATQVGHNSIGCDNTGRH